MKSKKNKKEQIDIKVNFGQDKDACKSFEDKAKELLKPLQDKGVEVKFEMRRKCDFCDRTIEDWESFRTLPDGKDVCYICQEQKGI